MKTKETAPIPQKTDEESRREFLVKAGKMALYMTPAMTVLMHPSGNALACSPRPPRCGWHPRKRPRNWWYRWR